MTSDRKKGYNEYYKHTSHGKRNLTVAARARTRAFQELARRHKIEFLTLYEAFKVVVRQEMEEQEDG